MRSYFYFFSITLATLSCAARNPGAATQSKLPPPQPAMERQIQNAVDAGDGDYEIRILRQRMAQEPDNLEVRLALARRYQAMGSTELALEHYRLAALRFPENAEVHMLLVKSLRRAGARAEATNMLQDFLRVHPQQSPVFASMLGILLDEQKQWADGEKAHREALVLAPKSDSLHNNLGYNLLMQGKSETAAAEFQEALKLNPRSEVARNNLGMALANKPDQSAVTWQSLGDPAAAHNNMAAVLIQQGRYAEARKELDIALGYNRSYPAALSNLKLVSELDGKPASITPKPVQSRWGRLKTGLRKAFIYDDEVEQPPSSAQTSTPENRRGL
jgi:Flp pilus assembly protein TadD